MEGRDVFRDKARPSEPDWVAPTWTELVRDRSAQVYRLAYRLTGNRHDAEDLTQDVFVRVFKSIHNLQPGTLEGWLHRITTNLFLGSARRRQRICMDVLSSAPEHVRGQDHNPGELHADEALDVDVANALAALKPEQRVAVVLCDIEGMSCEEISEVLGIKLGTMRNRTARGRTQLRDAFTRRAPSEDHTRYLGVSWKMWGNDCCRCEDDLSGSVDQILSERHVDQASEHLVRYPGCFAAVDELRRVRSKLNSCRAAATLFGTLAEKLQGIARDECDQPLYLTRDGPRRHSRGGRLIHGGMAATIALATLTMLSLALAKEPAVVGDPARATREQYSLALTTISVGQGVGAVQWARKRGARSGAATRLSPRAFDLGQTIPIDEDNAMIRLGNNGQSVAYSGRQRVWLMGGDGAHRPNDVEVDIVAGEGTILAILGGIRERFPSWFVPTMGCCSSLAETGWQFYTYQSSDTVVGRSASVVEARDGGHLVARWWLDDDTGLPLWVERYNTTGRPALVFEFVSINIGTAQLAADSIQPYPMEPVSNANISGWYVGLPECPLELGDLPLVAHASSDEGQNVYQRLVYPDDVRTLGVSWTSGVLAGGIRVSDDSPGLPQVPARQMGDGVVSVATSGSRSLVAEACKALPKPQENEYGLLERMASSLGRLVGIGRTPSRGQPKRVFSIDATELVLLLVPGVVMFDPEKPPAFARKAARVLMTLRRIVSNAQAQLRQELGPEYSGLKIESLDPKRFVTKHVREEIAAIEEAKCEIPDTGRAAKATTAGVTTATAMKHDQPDVVTRTPPSKPLVVPYNPEAA